MHAMHGHAMQSSMDQEAEKVAREREPTLRGQVATMEAELGEARYGR
jgi:hypothetical protein